MNTELKLPKAWSGSCVTEIDGAVMLEAMENIEVRLAHMGPPKVVPCIGSSDVDGCYLLNGLFMKWRHVDRRLDKRLSLSIRPTGIGKE
jgi:hypothetical protein